MKKYIFYLSLVLTVVLDVSNVFAEDSGIWQNTKEVAGDTWDGTKEVTSDVWDGAKTVTSDVWDGTKKVAGDVKDGMSGDTSAQTDTSAHAAKSHESENHNEHTAE